MDHLLLLLRHDNLRRFLSIDNRNNRPWFRWKVIFQVWRFYFWCFPLDEIDWNLGLNSCSSTPPLSFSHTIHHLPQTSSPDLQTPSISSLLSNSQIVSHQIVVINPNNEQRSSPSLKDLLSSQSTPLTSSPPVPFKQTFVVPSTPTTTNSSKSQKLLPSTNTDDGLYLRYEREQLPLTSNNFHFSYVIDESSSSTQKRLRYVSINDLWNQPTHEESFNAYSICALIVVVVVRIDIFYFSSIESLYLNELQTHMFSRLLLFSSTYV